MEAEWNKERSFNFNEVSGCYVHFELKSRTITALGTRIHPDPRPSYTSKSVLGRWKIVNH